MKGALPTELTEQRNIYSRIQPDLSRFSVEELEKALKELDNL